MSSEHGSTLPWLMCYKLAILPPLAICFLLFLAPTWRSWPATSLAVGCAFVSLWQGPSFWCSSRAAKQPEHLKQPCSPCNSSPFPLRRPLACQERRCIEIKLAVSGRLQGYVPDGWEATMIWVLRVCGVSHQVQVGICSVPPGCFFHMVSVRWLDAPIAPWMRAFRRKDLLPVRYVRILTAWRRPVALCAALAVILWFLSTCHGDAEPKSLAFCWSLDLIYNAQHQAQSL
jgi:hypothetical protein